jgi:O-antigen/teichoic acid export membrane protein
MNTIQRLLSNTILAFIGNSIAKVSGSILFILVGRLIGPAEAGVFNLGITYYTILLALSTWGLTELLVREVAPRRDEGGRYFVNYLVMRLTISTLFYAGLLLFLRLSLPYSEETTAVLRIMSLAIFPEAVFSLCQALFTANERLAVPTLAAIVNSIIRLGLGIWLLYNGAGATTIAWVIPISTAVSLLVFPPALLRLFRRVPQKASSIRLDWRFNRQQLRFTKGFVLLEVFQTVNFQLDTFIISLLLSEAAVGFYGASQIILAGFLMIPVAVRLALYPLMARYKHQDATKLALVYHKASQYLIVTGLPIAATVFVLAESIIFLVFGESFAPSTSPLRISIWVLVFAMITVPNARLMLVDNKQKQASWLWGLTMIASVSLNLLLIPRLGINGAAIARLLSTVFFFILIYAYVQKRLMRDNILPQAIRPLIATIVMSGVIWPLRDMFILVPVVVGILVYGRYSITR